MISFNELLDINHSKKQQVKEDTNKITDKIPWIEKYRPTKLNHVIYQQEVISMLKNTLKDGNLPHTLFYGKSGCGKTSTILAIAMELFGPKKFNDRVIELNASDERGINVVRKKIVTFAKSSIGTPDPNYPSPSYKIIILDEADAMTSEAQSALRKIMEDYSKITRFCFICNYKDQIIEPIKSRCAIFRFKILDEKSIFQKLKFISNKENIGIKDNLLRTLAKISNGDLRRAIMYLQNLKYNYKKITNNDILNLTGHLSDNAKKKITEILFKNYNNKIEIDQINNFVKDMILRGYSVDNIIKDINKIVVNSNELTDNMKGLICLHLAKTEKRLLDGADEYLQIFSVLLCVLSIKNNLNTIHKKIDFDY